MLEGVKIRNEESPRCTPQFTECWGREHDQGVSRTS